jgi:hypothetical protein
MALEIDGGVAPAQTVETIEPQPVEKSAEAAPPTGADSATEGASSKTGEVNFAGAYMAEKVDRAGKTEVTTPLTTAGAGGTQATYTVGAPTRPDIRHDNGFLQNPANPNDPKPQPTRNPTKEEQEAYNSQLRKANLALTAVNLGWPKALTPEQYDKYLDLPDGIAAYHHFLTGKGADRQFSYDKFVKDDTAGQTTLNNAIRDTQTGAEEIYRQMLAKDPSLANKPVTFQITGSQIGVGNSTKFPYPATENWQKAIGAHSIWNSATVTVNPPAKPGGEPTFSMRYTLHGEDRYNFNPGAADIATGQPDSDNGRFEQAGLAHQYMNYGTLQRDVTWTRGNIAGSTNTKTVGR